MLIIYHSINHINSTATAINSESHRHLDIIASLKIRRLAMTSLMAGAQWHQLRCNSIYPFVGWMAGWLVPANKNRSCKQPT